MLHLYTPLINRRLSWACLLVTVKSAQLIHFVGTFRVAKRKLDDCSFFGGVLHACYAPEYETVADTRGKLLERRREVARRIHIAGEYPSSF